MRVGRAGEERAVQLAAARRDVRRPAGVAARGERHGVQPPVRVDEREVVVVHAAVVDVDAHAARRDPRWRAAHAPLGLVDRERLRQRRRRGGGGGWQAVDPPPADPATPGAAARASTRRASRAGRRAMAAATQP